MSSESLGLPELGGLTLKAHSVSIFDIPVDVLAGIFEWASFNELPPPGRGAAHGERQLKWGILPLLDPKKWAPRTMVAIICTCKLFYNVGTSMLYQKLHLVGQIRSSESPTRLIRTMQENPALGRHCHELFISMDAFDNGGGQGINHRISPFLEALGENLLNVKTLSVAGAFKRVNELLTWNVLGLALSHMTSLQDLTLGGGMFPGPDLLSVIKMMQVPSLRNLQILSPTPVNSSFAECRDFRGADFSHLVLEDYEDSPEALFHFLHWPKKLTTFYLENIYTNHHYINYHYMELSMFRPMLRKHRDCLVSLNIGHLTEQGRGALLDLSDFTALEELTLSTYQWADNLYNASHDAELLLGPRLRRFTWDFISAERKAKRWWSFGEPQEQWLREFAQSAISKGSALKEIHIEYAPLSLNGGDATGRYPWDRMNDLRHEFGPQGIAFTYSKPLPRHLWDNRVPDGKESGQDSSPPEYTSAEPEPW